MRLQKLTLLFAAALLIGTMQSAKAEESPTTVIDTIADYEERLEESMDDGLDDADLDEDDDIEDTWRKETRAYRDRFDRRHRDGRPNRGPGPRGDFRHRGPHMGGYGHRMGGYDFRLPGMRHASMMFGPRIWEKLQLTSDQKTKVVDILTNNYRAKLEAKIEMIEARRVMRELYASDAPQGEAVVAAHTAMGALRGKMEVLDRQLKDELKNILTPEQQKTLDDMRKPKPRKPGPDGRGPGGRDKGPGDGRAPRGPDALRR